ncbi:hypothetical protein D2Q93_12995 [Alicyclobacillaceae bacterium I2511]|nr:hypothetical protein D2Q93_12995 [Alicyclobacillaceae bacterium I2511]
MPFQAEVWTNKRPPIPYSSKFSPKTACKPTIRDSHTSIYPSSLEIRRLDDWGAINLNPSIAEDDWGTLNLNPSTAEDDWGALNLNPSIAEIEPPLLRQVFSSPQPKLPELGWRNVSLSQAFGSRAPIRGIQQDTNKNVNLA